MSGQLRTLKNRIRSVGNTKKITHAMEMVAAAKLRRFQDTMVRARPFTRGLENLLNRLNSAQLAKTHPFFEAREEKQVALVLITSDTGLCGSYNNELIHAALRFLHEHHEKNPRLIGVGKMGINHLKRLGYKPHTTFVDTRASRIDEILTGLRTTIEALFLEKRADAIYVIYSRFLTVSKYEKTLEKLLPLGKTQKESFEETEYIFEPSEETIFKKLIPLYFEARVRMIFLESFVSEQIARMTAMHQATDNAEEMIDSLVLQRNKARQAAITKELIEIISGSRALKIK